MEMIKSSNPLPAIATITDEVTAENVFQISVGKKIKFVTQINGFQTLNNKDRFLNDL
jgi:hypothetical protein